MEFSIKEDDAVKKILEKTEITEEELLTRIEAKEIEFGGLVSKIGVICVVGKELGVNLVKPIEKELKIKNVLPDMRTVNFYGKIIHISETREFKTEKREGKVKNITIADETGTIRMSLWNEEIDAFGFEKGDVVEITGSYTKHDNLGSPEVRIGKGEIKKTDKTIEAVSFSSRKKITQLSDIKEGCSVEILASLLKIYERKHVFNFCPECRAKIDGVSCEKHKKVKPEKMLVLSGIVDDSSENINAVFFGSVAEKVIGKSISEIEAQIAKLGERKFIESLNLLGKEFKMNGYIKRNKLLNTLELQVQGVEEINTKKETESLLHEQGG